jgi:hypothetical protein
VSLQQELDGKFANQKHEVSPGSLTNADIIQSSFRDYERSAPIGMMHMNRSHISERGVRKRGNYSSSSAF